MKLHGCLAIFTLMLSVIHAAEPTPPFRFAGATIEALQAQMRGGSLTARELTAAYLQRIDQIDRAGLTLRAVIEVKVTPERGGGFNRFAERIARFDEVESCYLMSGGYDLLVFVRGGSLQKVAAFVSEKLSTVEGVLSTSTHFMLKTYKEQGVLMGHAQAEERLAVSP